MFAPAINKIPKVIGTIIPVKLLKLFSLIPEETTTKTKIKVMTISQSKAEIWHLILGIELLSIANK